MTNTPVRGFMLDIEPEDIPGLVLFWSFGGTRPAATADLRDGFRGTITAGTVWTWGDRSYAAVEEMHACVGYWVHAIEATVLLVPGLPAEQENLPFLRGLDLSGTEVPRPVSTARPLSCPVSATGSTSARTACSISNSTSN